MEWFSHDHPHSATEKENAWTSRLPSRTSVTIISHVVAELAGRVAEASSVINLAAEPMAAALGDGNRESTEATQQLMSTIPCVDGSVVLHRIP